MSTRSQNERSYPDWEDLSNGGRRYFLNVSGRSGWSARYIKEVDSNEQTTRFWQVYDDRGCLVERHDKFPVDSGHRKV